MKTNIPIDGLVGILPFVLVVQFVKNLLQTREDDKYKADVEIRQDRIPEGTKKYDRRRN